MNLKAVIDIGTNSIKFHMAGLKTDGSIATVIDTSEIARIGEGLRETGRISDVALARNVEAVAGFARRAEAEGADEIIAVGTMALRNAANAADFVAAVRETCGVEVRIIPGEEEARLSYLAALSGLDAAGGTNVVFDSGGGSTEFVVGQGRDIESRRSLNIGAVTVTEEFLKSDPVTDAELDAAMDFIRGRLEAAHMAAGAEHLVGMGGTVTTMGAVMHRMVEYDPGVIQGSLLTAAEIDSQIARYSSKTVEQRKLIAGLHPKRADIILAGACIVKMALELFKAEAVSISDRGLRHGLIFERFAGGAAG